MTAYEQQVRSQLKAFAEGEDQAAARGAQKALQNLDTNEIARASREGVAVELCVAGLVDAA